MNDPAAVFALALLLSQSDPATATTAGPPARQPEPPASEQTEPAPKPDPEPPRSPRPPAEEAPRPERTAPAGPAVPAPDRSEAGPASVETTHPPARAPPAVPAPVPAPAAPVSPGPGTTSAPVPAPPQQPAPALAPPPAPARPPEREQAARTALAFLDALVARDAAAIAASCGERFSFDGELRVGSDAVRSGWRAALATRRFDGPDRLVDLEVLPAAEAVARLGQPPPRVAPLAARGWVGIANVTGRPVVLFLAREGARMVVLGMHD